MITAPWVHERFPHAHHLRVTQVNDVPGGNSPPHCGSSKPSPLSYHTLLSISCDIGGGVLTSHEMMRCCEGPQVVGIWGIETDLLSSRVRYVWQGGTRHLADPSHTHAELQSHTGLRGGRVDGNDARRREGLWLDHSDSAYSIRESSSGPNRAPLTVEVLAGIYSHGRETSTGIHPSFYLNSSIEPTDYVPSRL